MRSDIWENMISLNSDLGPISEHIGPPGDYLSLGAGGLLPDDVDLPEVVARDPYPLPRTEDREGYFGDRHLEYWASGLRDYLNIVDCANAYNKIISRYLDLGCASGRVIRHFSTQAPDIQVFGCDINRRHVDWITTFLSSRIVAFQNSSIPHLPVPDASIDLLSAFSVFSHVEAFDTAWIMEIRRVLAPGGLAWITIHSENTWSEMKPTWPIHKALQAYPLYHEMKSSEDLPQERVVFRLRDSGSYSGNVFYHTDYIRRTWGRYLEILEIRKRFPGFQDAVILRRSHD